MGTQMVILGKIKRKIPLMRNPLRIHQKMAMKVTKAILKKEIRVLLKVITIKMQTALIKV